MSTVRQQLLGLDLLNVQVKQQLYEGVSTDRQQLGGYLLNVNGQAATRREITKGMQSGTIMHGKERSHFMAKLR